MIAIGYSIKHRESNCGMADIETGAGIITWATTTFSLVDVTTEIIKNGTSQAETPCATGGDTGMLALIGTPVTTICTCTAATPGRINNSGSTLGPYSRSKEESGAVEGT